MNDKIMSMGNMEDIVKRLNGCRSLLYMLGEVAEASTVPVEAIDGISDLLNSICRDLCADIEIAVDYIPTKAAKA